jgi:hypothetical protein
MAFIRAGADGWSSAGGIATARRARCCWRTAFVRAMDVMLWVCGGIALAAAVLALAFLPPQVPAETATDEVRTADEIGV